MASASKVTDKSTPQRNRSFSDSRAPSSRPVYDDLSDAHASITGRRAANLPTLSPGWAKDQPASSRNPKSTPLECVARMTSPVEGTPLNAAYGHVIAARGRDHVEVVTPTIDHPLRSRPVAPVGSPKIPESEVGEIGSKFPGVSRPGSSVDALTFHRWHSSLPNSQLDGPYRRSRSLNRLPEVPDIVSSQTFPNLTTYDFMRNMYQSHAHEDNDNEERPMDQNENTAELNTNIRELVSPVQASRTPSRRAQITHHGSYESFRAFLEETFSDADSEEVRPRVNSGIARLALYDSSGLVAARPVSQEGLEIVESNIMRHLGAPSNVSLVSDQADAHREIYGDMIRPQGRLSIEYDPEAFGEGFVHPSSSRSSSSISYATYHLRAYGYNIGEEPGSGGPPHDQVFGVPRTRTGTPPLLFGSQANGQASRPVVSMTNEADAERDWETVDDMSRQGTWTNRLQGTVSSRADYSSSSSEMRNRGLPAGGQQLQPPNHPRYVRSWNISRDEHTGQTVLLPENDTGSSRLTRPYISTPPSVRSRFFNNYHHPSQLSEGQEQLLNTSPLSLEPEHGSVSAQGLVSLPRRRPALNLSSLPHDVEAARELASDPIAFSCDDSSVLEMASMSKSARKNEHQESSRKDHSSAWVSTDETADDENFVQQHAAEGSFADFVAGGPRGNITGTPQGTGAREVGSSLANASSPYERLLSSPPMEEAPVVDGASKEKTLHQQTIGGSLDTISTTSSGALSRDLHRIPSSEYSQYSQDQDLTALPVFSSEFQSELYEHKQNLISAGILDPPAGAGPTRRSGPLALLAPIKDATASTGAALGRQFHRLPIIPALAPFRQRSPQRRAAPQDLTPTEPGPSNTLSQSDKMKASHPNKDARKRKVSDSEESIDAAPNQQGTSRNTYLLATATGPQRASVTTSAEPVPLEGVAIHPTTTANHGDRGRNLIVNAHSSRPVMATASNGFGGQATMSSNLGGQATLSNNSGGQTASSSNTNTVPAVHPYFGTAQHLHRARGQVGEEWELLYRDALGDGNSASEVLRSIQPVRRPVPPPGYNRRNLPRAREESPHLHRIPRRVDHQANLQYQKTFSQVALILCSFCPPFWLAYGLGYLDGVIAWVTDGDIKHMRQAEKKLALVLASAVTVVAVAGLVAALYFGVSGR